MVLSVATTLFQETLRTRLHERLTGSDVEKVSAVHLYRKTTLANAGQLFLFLQIITRVRESLSNIDELEPSVRTAVVQSYADGIQVALWFAVALGFIAVLCTPFIREKSLAR